MKNPTMLIAILALAAVLTACGALPDVLPGGGAEEEPPPPAIEEPPLEPPPTDPPPPTATLPLQPTPTPTSAFGEATDVAEEATPTRVAPLEETPEGEATPTPSGEEMTPEPTDETPTPEVIEVTPLGSGDGQGGGGNGEETPTPEPPVTPDETATPEGPVTTVQNTYTVQSGDTLGKIASAFGTTIQEIVDLNKGTYPSLESNPNAINIGWVLTLPGATFTGQTYTVQQADVLEEIAKQFGTTVEVLVSLNEDAYPSLRTNPGEIEIGWVLKVPG